MPGQFQMSELYKNASSSYIKSINYYNDHEKEIKIATQYCKDVSEKIYEEKLQKYQDELEKKQKSAKKTIRLNGAVKGLSGILQLASGYGLFAAAPATAGTSIIPGGSFIVFGTSDLIEGLGEVFAGEDQKNPLCEAAFFGDEKAYHVVNFIYTIVSPIILNKITGPCTIGGKVSDIAGHVEGGSGSLIDIDKIRPQLKTEPDTAFFWSGRTEGIGGSYTAANIAKGKGGVTLESTIEAKKIVMPEWDFNNPSTMEAWDLASGAYAEQVSGEIRAVVGSELRTGNIWENIELPRLKANPNVTKITIIDPKTQVETIIFKR